MNDKCSAGTGKFLGDYGESTGSCPCGQLRCVSWQETGNSGGTDQFVVYGICGV